MTALIEMAGKEHEVPCGTTIEDAVRGLGFRPDAFIFMIGGRPVPMDTPIEDAVLIKAVRVASGG